MTPVHGDLSFLHYPPDDWWHLFVVVPLGTAIGQVALWEFINSLALLAYAVVGVAVVATFIVVATAALKLAWEGWDG